MPKIVVTILRPLPETPGCGNIKTMSGRSITALPSVSGRQYIYNMWVAFSEIWCYFHPVPFLGSAQQNISLFCLLLNLAVQSCLVHMAR